MNARRVRAGLPHTWPLIMILNEGGRKHKPRPNDGSGAEDWRPFMPSVIYLLVTVQMLGQTEPGTIAVVDGDLAVVSFAFPAGTPYQVDDPISRVNLWRN